MSLSRPGACVNKLPEDAGYGSVEIANCAIPTLPQPRLRRDELSPKPGAYGVRILRARSNLHQKIFCEYIQERHLFSGLSANVNK